MPSRSSSPERSHSNPKLSSSHARSYPIATSGAPGPRSCAMAKNKKPSSRTMIPIAIPSATSEPDALDLAREIDVFGGQPPGVVRGERDPHPLPAHVEVRVVISVFGEEADPHDEGDCGGERSAVEGLDDLVALAAPSRQVRQAGRDLGIRQGRHGHYSTGATR